MYLRSRWALAFMLAFVAVLVVNTETREARDVTSAADNALNVVELKIKRAEKTISHINGTAGELAAYWSLIAVFVYYYEVIARYVFNSPTNWAHEAMFLMFGTQYLIAGGFCLRENAHVRVDVIYTQLSERTKAIMDLVTSAFFFIFVLTLLGTGWIFFHDAFEINEVSFTEWGIQYWPIKLALPVGAVLLLLQGIAQLMKDIAALRNGGAEHPCQPGDTVLHGTSSP